MKNILYLLILTFFVMISCSNSTRAIDLLNGETTDSMIVETADSVIVETTDSAIVGKYEFELIQKNDQAFLKNGELEELLNLEPPCYFLRLNEDVLTYSYSDVNVKDVLIIIGDMATDEEKKIFGADLDMVCGMKKQGLYINDSGPKLTEKILSGGLACKDYGLDEKDFWDFAH